MADRERERTGSGWLPELDPLKLVNGKVSETLLSSLHSAVAGLIKAFNGGISLGDGTVGSWAGNLDAHGDIEVVTPATPDTDFEVPHGLNRVPVGYEVTRRSAAGIVYDVGSGNWGLKMLYLRCNVASMTIRLRVW